MITPISTRRCFQMRLLVSSCSKSSMNLGESNRHAAILSVRPAGKSFDTPTGTEIVGMETRTRRGLVELHQLLTFLETPQSPV